MRILLRLFPLLRPYRLQVFFALFATLALTGLQLVVPAIIRQVIDVGLIRRDVAFLGWSAAALAGVGLTRAVLVYLQRFTGEWLAAHIGYDLRNRLYDHIQYLPFSFHDHTQTGQIISRCIEDVRAVERFTGFSVSDLIRLFLLTIGILTLLIMQSPGLAAIALLPLIPLVAITTYFGSRIGDYFMRVDVALGDLSSILQENVSGVQVVRAFAREGYEMRRFARGNRILYNARVAVNSMWSYVLPSTHALVATGTILILWFGGRMVIDGQMTIGEVVAFNAYLLLLSAPAQQLTWQVNAAGEAVAGLRRTFEILDLPPAIATPANAIVLPPLRGQIDFEHVCFRYVEAVTPALEDINLHISPHQVVALIGQTGSGKSSLINLIPRFYDPSEGVVRVDGYDVRQVDLPSLRRQIGLVLQTSLLFSDSIAQNIAYGRPEASQAEIETAARAAQAHDFILALPEGYETVVGERGVTLSGGQRQRVAIARALLMDPRILIMDDSTSSVDMETERLIQQALQKLMEGRTTFVIAHRLSTVRRADLILVMQDGRIAEQGRHEELLQRKGLYRQIYDLQLKEQELAEETS